MPMNIKRRYHSICGALRRNLPIALCLSSSFANPVQYLHRRDTVSDSGGGAQLLSYLQPPRCLL